MTTHPVESTNKKHLYSIAVSVPLCWIRGSKPNKQIDYLDRNYYFVIFMFMFIFHIDILNYHNHNAFEKLRNCWKE